MEQSAKERLVKMRRFMNEYQYATGKDGHSPFGSGQLPAALPDTLTIRIPRDVMVRFRNDWFLLLQFAALVCNCELEELTPFHLIAPFLKMGTEGNMDEEEGVY